MSNQKTSHIFAAPTAPFVTAEEFARLTGQPVRRIKDQLRSGQLPQFKLMNTPTTENSRALPLVDMYALHLHTLEQLEKDAAHTTEEQAQ